MTHSSVVEQMLVERYLLGELTGEVRDQFEDHLFDCVECANDVKQGVLFLDASRLELKAAPRPAVTAAPTPLKRPSPIAWLWQPWVLVPALAACLAVIAYQSAFVMPHLRAAAEGQIAMADTPTVVHRLVLANAGARGDSTATIIAPRHGVYLLTVDIPPSSDARLYRCSFVSPTGKLLGHIDLTPQQIHDAVTIQIPAGTAEEGINELLIQSISSQSNDDRLVELATYHYQLTFAK